MCGVEKEKPIDFVLEIAREEKLEPISVRIRGEPYYMEEDETGIMDVLDMIFEIGQQTGGFVLNIGKTVPEFITIVDGYRPNEFSRYYYNRSSVLVTDGKTIFISRTIDSDGNTHHDVYYKFKVINATFALEIRHEKNNFNGEQEFLDVILYGRNEKLEKVLRRLNDLLSP
jgi:hypothetical protein